MWWLSKQKRQTKQIKSFAIWKLYTEAAPRQWSLSSWFVDFSIILWFRYTSLQTCSLQTLSCSLQPKQTSQQRPADASPTAGSRGSAAATSGSRAPFTLHFSLYFLLPFPHPNPSFIKHYFCCNLESLGPNPGVFAGFFLNHQKQMEFNVYLYHHDHITYNGWEVKNKQTFCKLTNLCIFPHRMHNAVSIKHRSTNRTAWNNTLFPYRGNVARHRPSSSTQLTDLPKLTDGQGASYLLRV